MRTGEMRSGHVIRTLTDPWPLANADDVHGRRRATIDTNRQMRFMGRASLANVLRSAARREVCLSFIG
jgi:hypothetical protein